MIKSNMQYIHYKNDFSLDLDLTSKAIGTSIDGSLIRYVRFFTRNNGRTYVCCYGNGTLINKGTVVTAICNNSNLEAGILKYTIEFQIPDSTYPDQYKKIEQTYVSEIELVKGNGETENITVQAMFGTTIDGKFNDLETDIDEVSEEVEVISADIVSIKELNTVQDASINHIEDIIATIDGGTSETIEVLNTSVNALYSDVSSLNASVNSLQEETENNTTGLTGVTNTVNDVSTRVNDVETVLGRKADSSVLSNYYTKDESYNKDEVDRAIADAAMDGSLPAGIVIDNNYVHTDNNYTTEDKNKVRDFDLSLYPTNSSLSANYATKAELQNVDDNHPSNASISNNYVKKNEIDDYLTDYPTNSSLSSNYALKTDLNDYPTNSSLSSNYATKSDIRDLVDIEDVSFWVTEQGYITNNDVSQFATETWVNENYCDLENIDEIILNVIDNNLEVTYKVNEIVNDSSTISDISSNVSDVSVKIDDVSFKTLDISTRLDRNYLTTSDIQSNYVLNSSLVSNYTTKEEFNEVWTTGFLTQDSADTLYASKADISDFITDDDVSVYATKAQVSNDISTFITENDLEGELVQYLKKNDLDSEVSTLGYIKSDDVSNFVTTDDISTFITENDVSVYATKEEVSNDISTFITSNDVSVYATTSYVDTQIGNIQNILASI